MRLIKAALTLVFAAFLVNCGGSSDPTTNRTFFNNSELETSTLTRTSGDNIVFKWEFIHPEDSDREDDELTEIIYFEIPGGRTSFNFSFDAGISTPIAYDRICVCPSDTYTIAGGFVDGSLVNPGEWRVAMSLSIRNSDGLFLPILDEASFTLGN